MHLDKGLQVDRGKTGWLTLLPEMPSGVDPHDHIYTQIKVMTAEVALDCDTEIRGTWQVAENWDLFGAFF